MQNNILYIIYTYAYICLLYQKFSHYFIGQNTSFE